MAQSKICRLVFVFAGIFAFNQASSSDDMERLQRQLQDLEGKMRADMARKGGITYEEYEELGRLCLQRHPNDAEAYMECLSAASDNMRRDDRRKAGPSSSQPGSIGRSGGSPRSGSRPGQDNRTAASNSRSQWSQQIISSSGENCIQIQLLDPRRKTASKNYCEVRDERGSCFDVEYSAKITNNCNGPIDFRYTWHDKYRNPGLFTLSGASSRTISCRKSLDGCSGRFDYSMRSGR